jgi:hypothetical protein
MHSVAPFLLPHKAESEPEKQVVEVRTGKQKIEVSAEGRQATTSWMTQ